jgi:hypothetical protein
MLYFYIHRQQWIYFALALGAILVLWAVLSYLTMWSPRKVEREEANIEIRGVKDFFIWFQAAFPWVLILTLIGTVLLAIVYPFVKIAHPPNW